jgi:DNA-binding LytR/AlgR family response regulator
MSKELQKRVERLFLPQQPIISRKNELIRAGDIVFMQYQKGRVEAVTADGLRYELPDNLNYYESLFKGYFLRVHRSYLVAVERIEGTFERFPDEVERADLRGKEDECELALNG